MFGVRIIPPNGSIQPNPMSSITMYITFGEPSGATGGIGKRGLGILVRTTDPAREPFTLADTSSSRVSPQSKTK